MCRFGLFAIGWIGFLAALPSCRPKGATNAATSPAPEKDALVRVGSIVLYQTDLDHELAEKHAARTDEVARKKALDELVRRAQLAQAALDAGLDRHPAVRAQVARSLAARLREEKLAPRLKELTVPIPEARLRELYAANESRFRSEEKRQAAVLWLNPNSDPARRKAYEEKLTGARDWFFKNGDVKDHPEQGFSVLSVDHSEHAGSRFKGGVVEWLSRAGGADAWSKAVAEIVSLVGTDYDWSAEVAKITSPTLVVVGDWDSVRISHAAKFFELLGGSKQDAMYDRSGMNQHRMAVLPNTTHYESGMSPALPPVVIPFLDGYPDVPRFAG